jgi:hypothetical protein
MAHRQQGSIIAAFDAPQLLGYLDERHSAVASGERWDVEMHGVAAGAARRCDGVVRLERVGCRWGHGRGCYSHPRYGDTPAQFRAV